jgi:hypothetical protein
MQQLPIGIQSFNVIREGNYRYVDKTKDYIDLLKNVNGKYIFFARPRRFGKSLMLSTIKYLYTCEKALFTGLWAENNWDWEKPYPVVHVDLNSVNTLHSSLEKGLLFQIQEHAAFYGVALSHQDAKTCFIELLKKLTARGLKPVVLIDEYDKPITDNIGQPALSEEYVRDLKSFYGAMKSMDDYIHIAIITGVSTYGATQIFSGLNNVNNISMNQEYATLCGYTQTELEQNFDDFLEKTSQSLHASKAELLAKMKYWYNGYSWNGKEEYKIYNPFSVLLFFEKKAFKNYWFETGTPTLLIELIEKDRITPTQLEYLKVIEWMLHATDIQRIDAISLLFQTGYLTIKEIVGKMDRIRYILGFPNEEVRQSFSEHLPWKEAISSDMLSKIRS